MDIDALKLALLAVLAPEQAPIHSVHGEVEHWLNRPLASAEIDAALAALETHGLVAARTVAASLVYSTTDAGRAVVAAQWEEFFPP